MTEKTETYEIPIWDGEGVLHYGDSADGMRYGDHLPQRPQGEEPRGVKEAKRLAGETVFGRHDSDYPPADDPKAGYPPPDSY